MEKEKRVAIVGGGVAGLAAAWHLSTNTSYQVQLFEASDKLGGHANTVNVHGVDVDIGFMVFNDDNYPNMKQWFRVLGVEEEDSDMSLSVSLDGGNTVEWNSDGLNGAFAKRSQIFQPSFYKFIMEMMRFNAQATQLLQLSPDDPRRRVTTGQYLRDHHYSETFCTYYLLPMMAAIWSASIEDVLQFPAEQMIDFFCNHKLLQLFSRPQWKTVANRSKSYTLQMAEILGDNAHVSTPILAVDKTVNGSISYELFTTNNQSVGVFDQVVFCCHPPTTSKMLSSIGNAQLCETLDKIEYADNVVYVHSDPQLMPQRRRAWASWNCMGKSNLISILQPTSKKGEAMEGGESGFGNKSHQVHWHLEGEQGRMKGVYVTYWLNRLQNLKTTEDIFVSLNPHQRPQADTIHQRVIMAHPQFSRSTLAARNVLEQEYQGKEGLWFCGAWRGYGFHEDGCRAGFQVATQLSGVPLPWAQSDDGAMVLAAPDLSRVEPNTGLVMQMLNSMYHSLTYELPVAICKRFINYFLQKAVQKGRLELKLNDGTVLCYGDGSPCGIVKNPVTIRVFEPWFFVKTALEYDLGFARSYMAGYITVEPLADTREYSPELTQMAVADETTTVLGDPVGLTRLFLLLIGNRDNTETFTPRKSKRGHSYASSLTNASGLVISKIGSMLNYLRYKMMDNSERGGSLKNIHAHYDLSNDLFTTFLDKETLMYSCAIYDAVKAQVPQTGLAFRGSLEDAQWRKLDTLLDRAQIQPGQKLLDIGFGWGGLSLLAAKKYGCQVTGITLSVEQKALAEKRVKKQGLEHLITFEVVDYRVFSRRPENRGRFDRVVSCEMIEAVGHAHLGEFFWAVEQVLAHDGVLVMEAITTPEERYESYRRSTDFINTVIFPGGCAPSLHALVDAAYGQSALTLEHIDNIGLHYAQTLVDWRRRFNANETFVRSLGFDDVFLRVWNYYLTYCEAGFLSQTINCLILVFARPGCRAIVPLSETRSVTQAPALTDKEVNDWLV